VTAIFLVFRVLDRAAPRFTDLLGKVIDAAHNFQQLVRNARPDVLTMRVGATRFRLQLVGGNKVAHGDYLPLLAEDGVYEPVATACLTRVLQRLPEPAFMDIGALMGYFTCHRSRIASRSKAGLGRGEQSRLLQCNPTDCDAQRVHPRPGAASRPV
jgi:hypothetical protein